MVLERNFELIIASNAWKFSSAFCPSFSANLIRFWVLFDGWGAGLSRGGGNIIEPVADRQLGVLEKYLDTLTLDFGGSWTVAASEYALD